MKRSRWPNRPPIRYEALTGPDHHGFQVVFEENLPVAFLGDLLVRFYQHNHYEYLPCLPIAVYLETPSPNGMGSEGREPGWYFVYYRRFLVHIEKNYESNHGPHRARLMYKAEYAPRLHWVATLQVQEFFYSEDMLMPHIFAAIMHRKFYQTPMDAQRIVVL